MSEIEEILAAMTKDFSDKLDKLEEYGDIECNELGEFWLALAGLGRASLGGLCENEFIEALEKQIDLQLSWIDESFTIVEE